LWVFPGEGAVEAIDADAEQGDAQDQGDGDEVGHLISDFGFRISDFGINDRPPRASARPKSEIRNPKSEIESFARSQAGEAHEGEREQAGEHQGQGGALHHVGDAGEAEAFAQASHQQ